MIYDYEALAFRIMGVIKVDHEKGYFKVAGRPYAALSTEFPVLDFSKRTESRYAPRRETFYSYPREPHIT